MELKFEFDKDVLVLERRFNRTFMGLKYYK